jgi:hypothetical protein
MNTKMLWTAAAALMVAFAAGPARADDPTPTPKTPAVKVTPAEKEAAKTKRKQDLADAKAKGEVTKDGDAQPTAPYKASGTHESRSAERKANRAKMADANKKGEIPKIGEAGEPKK